MRFSLIVSTLVLLSSCGHGLKKSESFTDKMSRYKASQYSNNKVPSIKLPKVKTTQASRAPASIAKVKPLSISNKRLYFLTLNSQYETLSKLVGPESSQLNICPNFHTSLLKQQQAFGKRSNGNKINFDKLNYTTNNFSPEVYLPVTRNSTHPMVKDILKEEGNVAVEKALKLHLNKTFSELSELCEFGNSDNYYTFENLYTLIQRGEVKFEKDRLDALMKTTLFTNNILIKSLKSHKSKMGRFPASTNKQKVDPLMREIFNRFKSPLTDKHLDLIYTKRN